MVALFDIRRQTLWFTSSHTCPCEQHMHHFTRSSGEKFMAFMIYNDAFATL